MGDYGQGKTREQEAHDSRVADGMIAVAAAFGFTMGVLLGVLLLWLL